VVFESGPVLFRVFDSCLSLLAACLAEHVSRVGVGYELCVELGVAYPSKVCEKVDC
jgi:hypothetical protein